jgi:ASC-1-like (ASCH) protein
MGFKRSVKTEVVRVTDTRLSESTSWLRNWQTRYRHTGLQTGTKGEGLQAVYDKADEKDHGVLAIQVKVVAK